MNKRLISICICFFLVSTSFIGLINTVGAAAPDNPGKPSGPSEGSVDVSYRFSVRGVNTTDNHDVLYLFDWGDGFDTGWLGPYPSKDQDLIRASHKWKESGDYQIKVKAKDNTTGEESNFSEPLMIHIIRLEIGTIAGGFGISIAIKNVGEISKNVEWYVKLCGGQLSGLHINKHFNGSVFIKAGTTEIVTISPIFALGRFKIEVTAECSGEPAAKKTVNGVALFFYVLIT